MVEIDILIIGGGLIGMTLTRAFGLMNYRVRMIEAYPSSQAPPPHLLETRSIALSPSSMCIFNQLKIWPSLSCEVSPIQTIHVSEQGRFGAARLQSHKSGEALGYVVGMHVLQNILTMHLNDTDIIQPAFLVALDAASGLATIRTDSGEQHIKAQWVIAADGQASSVRKYCDVVTHHKAYAEHALVTNIALSRAHQQIAYERFTQDGPLALLPLKGPHMAVVWTLKAADAKRLQLMEAAAFLESLQRTFGYRTGKMIAVGARNTYPLKQVVMPKQIDKKVVFIGNAAHTLHPVAGQGFNLGLRDVAMLIQCAAQYGLTEQALKHYQSQRITDQSMTMRATDGLVSLFKNAWPGIGFARGMGLLALDNSNHFKNLLLRYGQGFGGMVPDLVCGFSLDTMTKAFVCQTT